MFVTRDSTSWNDRGSPVRASAISMARASASREVHLRASLGGLRYARSGIAYCLDALTRWDDSEWALVEETVARELSSATQFLAGALDGLAILDQEDEQAREI